MSQSPLKCHIGSTTININVKPHHCPECERSFDKLSSLALHVCAHNGIKPFFCNICGKGFNREPNYREHVRSHTGEKPFSCKICKGSYTRLRNAIRHVKYHLFQKPLTCSKCRKGYFRKPGLNRHMRLAHMVHNKHYEVTVDSDFKDSYDKSTLTHSRRFYMCKVCRIQFSSVSNLTAHECSTKKLNVRPLLINCL